MYIGNKYNKQATKQEKLVYNKKAASRILGIKYIFIEFVAIFDDYILVGIYNDTVKVEKSKFKIMFVEDRKQRSKSLTATKQINNETQYTVRNESNGHSYKINLSFDSVYCECADYHNKQNQE